MKESGKSEQEVVLGKVNVVTYEYIARKVIIVPVNESTNLSAAMLQSSLNEIYGQAVAGWQLSIDPVFTIAQSYITKLDEEESGNFASYNTKMRAFNKKYKETKSDYDRNAFYIFLIKGSDFKYNGFMPFKRGFGYVFVDKTPNLIKTIAHELGHGAFNLRHTFSEYPSTVQSSTDNLMDYKADGKVLKKYQWDNIHDPESLIGWLQDDEEGAWRNTLADRSFAALFDHVYENHHIGNQNYLQKIKASKQETIDLEYKGTLEKDFIDTWKIRAMDLSTAFNDELKSIIETPAGKKIPSVILRKRHIYLGEYVYNNRSYPVAVYGNGDTSVMVNAFTKVQVLNMKELSGQDVRTHLHIQENLLHYFIIGFFEDGKDVPSIIMQIQKFHLDNSLVRWLKYLNIILFEDGNSESVFLNDITWVSQKDEGIFGQCTGCWPGTCCRRATEYMMGNTNIANCSDVTIAQTAPNMAILEKMVTAYFDNNSSTYTSATYNQQSLKCDTDVGKVAADYIEERLRMNKPVLLGVHYTEGTSKPPNNANRATRHYMVIVGFNKSTTERSFRFYDPGRSIDNSASATSPSNLLTVNSNGCITGQYRGRSYTMSEILKTN